MSDEMFFDVSALRHERLTHFTSSNSLVLLFCFSSWIVLQGQKIHWHMRHFLCFTWKHIHALNMNKIYLQHITTKFTARILMKYTKQNIFGKENQALCLLGFYPQALRYSELAGVYKSFIDPFFPFPLTDMEAIMVQRAQSYFQ